MMKRLEYGDHVRLRLHGHDDDWTPAFVALASRSNPSSVMLMLDGVVRAHGGFVAKGLPLIVDYDAQTAISLWGDDYEIEVAA